MRSKNGSTNGTGKTCWIELASYSEKERNKSLKKSLTLVDM